jgi:GNAT superfamily N-acetyltransferase
VSASIQVRPVHDAAQARAFCALPYRLYRRDPLWVPPLARDEAARWRPSSNVSLRSRWHARFLAYRGDEPVGRVAAILDPTFTSRWAPGAGFIGFFECERDPAASRILLSRAEGALREKGARRVLGPVNLTTHDEVGLLVAGYDRPPAVLTPYNPPFYVALLEDAGYAPVRDYRAYDWTPGSREAGTLHRLAQRAPGASIRAVDPRAWDDEVDRLHRLYNAAFADVWGFVPLSLEEFAQRAGQFKAFYRPELVLLAEQEGEAVGFAVLLPDVHVALPAARGRLLPLGWWRLLRAVRRIRSGRFVLMGVRPEAAGRGLAAHLALAMGRAVRAAGYRHVDVSLVLDENARMRRVIEAFGCTPSRSYRLFGKELEA